MSVPENPTSCLLKVSKAGIRFGGIAALDGVTFEVHRGTVCGLIGPNGAGKTTLFNCLSRLYDLHSGSIAFESQDLARMQPHHMAKLGIARTFQNLALFRSLSVLENVMLGAHSTLARPIPMHVAGAARARSEEGALRQRATDLLLRLGLGPVADRLVSELPFGTQKRVELARALAISPKLLLLDEPAAGLNYQEVDSLRGTIREICDVDGVTVLLVEHHMNLVMRVSDKVVALNFGRKIADGSPEEVQANPEVVTAYLGVPA